VRVRAWPCLLLLLLAAAGWQLGNGLWIHAKAQLAQYLIERAWQQTLIRHEPVKPWPWADTWPVARLQWGSSVDLYVLAGVNGAALPFGPGMTSRTDGDDQLIAGHRDTHFDFLARLEPGDRLLLTDMQGNERLYQVNTRQVMDSRRHALIPATDEPSLLLVTCYPFDALHAGGPLRYVVSASPIHQRQGLPQRI